VSAPASAPYRVVLLRAGSLEGKVVLNRNHLAFDAAMEQEATSW